MDVHLNQVAKSFGKVQALKPLSLTIRSGQFTTLLGPSGCGKTTLLRMIAGLEAPDHGEIRFGDEVVFSAAQGYNKPAHKRQLGMVFQDFALWPHMTVFENVAYGLRATGQGRLVEERVAEALRAVRLLGFEKRYPGQLSGGQQQRVAFARAVAVRPKLILFDEPLSALDAVLREEMRMELMALVAEMRLTALYVTHDQTEAMSMSDEIVVMKDGEVSQVGAPEQIYARPVNREVARFVGKSNWLSDSSSMFRPEHLQWQGKEQDYRTVATVKAVSYIGDRYEVLLDVQAGETWLGYHQERLPIGSRAKVYVQENHIHAITGREALAR